MRRESIKSVMSLTAFSSMCNILVSVAKVKIIALYFGPTGVGILGLMQSILQLAGLIVSNGMNTAGTKKIAEDINKANGLDRNLLLGFIVGITLQIAASLLLVYCFSEKILGFLGLGSFKSLYALSLGVTAFAIFTVIQAVYTGMRQIKKLILIQIFSAVSGSSIGIFLSLVLGESYLVACVISTPIMSIIFSLCVFRPKFQLVRDLDVREIFGHWNDVSKLGIVVVMSYGVTLLTQTILKSIIASEQGIEQLGYYQAASTVSTTYLGVITVALANDYLPRLSEASRNHCLPATVEKQISIVAILSIPIVFFTITFAPQVVSLLYSNNYSSSIELLRLLVVGDLLRCFSMTLAYTFLAENKLSKIIIIESLANLFFLICSVTLLPLYGIISTGYSYILMYLFYFLSTIILTRRAESFLISDRSIVLILISWISLVVLYLLLENSKLSFVFSYLAILFLLSPILLKKEANMVRTSIMSISPKRGQKNEQ